MTLAFPADWTGRLARLAGWLVGGVFVLWVLAGSVPNAIVAEVSGVSANRMHVFFLERDMQWLAARVEVWGTLARGLVRLLGASLGFLVARLAMRVVAVWLPNTPVLVGQRIWMRSLGQRHRIATRDVRAVFVEHVPDRSGETLMLELRDGRTLPVCPLSWDGAGRLYERIMARRRGRRARRGR